MSILSFNGVSKRFEHTEAVRDLTFDVHEGEMFGLIGPDGAGKTTTIRLACGLLRSDGGAVRVFGHHPVRDHRHVTNAVGYFSQRFSLYGDLSIDENIEFFASIHGVRSFRDRRDRLLDMMQLTAFRTRLADRLSGGMKQKLALACTLIHQPKLILLDEPTTGVDPVSRREFWKLLSEFLLQGITIVMATPYLDEAERCSRVALLSEGRLLALDDPSALRAGLSGQMIELVAEPRDAAIEAVGQIAGVRDVQAFGDRLHIRLKPDASLSADALAQVLAAKHIKVAGARAIPPSLEDVFIDKVTS